MGTSILLAMIIFGAQGACLSDKLSPAHRHFRLGAKQYQLQNYRQALAEFNTAIKLDPKHPEFFQYRGRTFERLKDDEHALADYSEAIKLGPRTASSYLYRGLVYLREKDLDRARTDFTKAIELDPKSAEAYFYRGASHDRRGDYQQAITDLTKAITRNPQAPMPYLLRGSCHANSGDCEKALADASKAIKLAPELWQAYNDKAWILATCAAPQWRDGNLALTLAQQANRRTGWSNAGFLDTLAAACAEAGKFDEAAKWQEEALVKMNAEMEPLRPMLEERLRMYREHRPYRETPEEVQESRRLMK